MPILHEHNQIRPTNYCKIYNQRFIKYAKTIQHSYIETFVLKLDSFILHMMEPESASVFSLTIE